MVEALVVPFNYRHLGNVQQDALDQYLNRGFAPILARQVWMNSKSLSTLEKKKKKEKRFKLEFNPVKQILFHPTLRNSGCEMNQRSISHKNTLMSTWISYNMNLSLIYVMRLDSLFAF